MPDLCERIRLARKVVLGMGEERTRLSVAYGQYFVMTPAADLPRASTGGTGLVGAHPGAAFVVCGTQSGTIELTVQTQDAAPSVNNGPWDEVVEVGLDCPAGELIVAEWGGGGSRFNLASAGPGPYRLRVHARGRDAARDGESHDSPIEHHLIIAWPDAATSTVIQKATDQVGAYRRHVERDEPSDIESAPTDVAMFGRPPWDPPPVGDGGRHVPSDLALVRRPTLEITLTGIVMHSTGWLFNISVRATRGDLDESRWRRVGKIVGQGFVRLNGPGKPPTTHRDGLQLSVGYEGGSPVTTARSIGTVPELMPPNAPSLTGYAWGAEFLGDVVQAQHRGWLWPAPPAGPIQLTLQWNALDIAPTSIELDGITPPD